MIMVTAYCWSLLNSMNSLVNRLEVISRCFIRLKEELDGKIRNMMDTGETRGTHTADNNIYEKET